MTLNKNKGLILTLAVYFAAMMGLPFFYSHYYSYMIGADLLVIAVGTYCLKPWHAEAPDHRSIVYLIFMSLLIIPVWLICQQINLMLLPTELHHFSYTPVMILVICLLTPAAEELVFRGVLLRWLNLRFVYSLAVVIQAAVFGSLHGSAGQILAALFLGLYLGTVAEVFRNLWPCIMLHSLFNLATITVPKQWIVSVSQPASIWVIFAILISAALLLMCSIQSKKNHSQ